MSEWSTHRFSDAAGLARVVVTDRELGDLRVDQPDGALLVERRGAVTSLPWVWLRQVHGSTVVTVDSQEVAGGDGDALVTGRSDVALAVHTADCAPVVFFGESMGLVGMAHAGWRGLAAGVLDATAARMNELGEWDLTAQLGPCICADHYEFGERDLEQVAERLGEGVVAVTPAGRPALDLRAGVRTALGRCGVDLIEESTTCTAEHPERLYSHRARGDQGRQAMVVWKEAT